MGSWEVSVRRRPARRSRAAYAGEVLITPSMLLRLLPKVTHQYDGVGAGLSRRELEVLSVMAEGGTDKDIAGRLFVSLNTRASTPRTSSGSSARTRSSRQW